MSYEGEISSFLTYEVLETDVIGMSHLSFQRDIRVDVFNYKVILSSHHTLLTIFTSDRTVFSYFIYIANKHIESFLVPAGHGNKHSHRGPGN